jgi:heme exporter protein A
VRHDRTLFDALSFTLNDGEILQVEGANGSGKTSLLRMLCGLVQPDEGMILWDGADIGEDRAEFLTEALYIGHAHGVKEELTPRENLRFAQALGPAGHTSTEAALARVGLYGYEDVPARMLSAGQRRRVALARLLVRAARLWVLDEPFTALDRVGRELVETLLAAHIERGGLAVLTTHQPHALAHCPTVIHLGTCPPAQ